MVDKPPQLYKPFKYNGKGKFKKSVYVKSDNKKGYKIVSFGDARYSQFKDKLGSYSHLDNNDPKRKKAYYARHGKEAKKDSAKYFSHKYLW